MRPEIRDAQFHTFRFAPYYAVLWYATERTPPADLGKFVEQLEGPPVAKIDVDGSTLLVPSDQQEGFFQAVRPSPFRAGKSPKLPQDTPVKSDLAYFADGYAALRRGDYDTAVGRFIAMADRYPVEGYVLGYFAYAAAKSGDKEHLEAYIDSRKGPRDFDSWLAKAFFAGARGDVKTALAALQSAFRVRPSTEYRPVLTAYEYAQACEWLLKDTGDSRFKAALLDWVKKYEVIQPTHAWAYAIEYAYEKPGPERLRALALARYLDPRSDRIRSASKDELNQAQSWLRDHDPFRVPDRAPDHSRAKTAALERMGDRSS